MISRLKLGAVPNHDKLQFGHDSNRVPVLIIINSDLELVCLI